MPDSPHISGHSDIEVGFPLWNRSKFPIRMSEDLRDCLKAEAEPSVRSLNSEIVFRLKKSIEAQRLDHASEPAT
jgi:hypothetical protein